MHANDSFSDQNLVYFVCDLLCRFSLFSHALYCCVVCDSLLTVLIVMITL
jgi:hypothetical protein